MTRTARKYESKRSDRAWALLAAQELDAATDAYCYDLSPVAEQEREAREEAYRRCTARFVHEGLAYFLGRKRTSTASRIKRAKRTKAG